MMIGWSQVSVKKRLTFLGVGILMCLVALYTLWWSPLLDDIDQLKAEIQGQEQATRAAQFKAQTLQDVDQQFLQVRHDLQERFSDISGEMDPQKFRTEVMELAKRLDVTVRVWKPDARVAEDHRRGQPQGIAVRVEGDFYQGVAFMSGLEALPWIQSIASVKVMRIDRVGGGTTTGMDIKIQIMPPSVFEEAQKLLAT